MTALFARNLLSKLLPSSGREGGKCAVDAVPTDLQQGLRSAEPKPTSDEGVCDIAALMENVGGSKVVLRELVELLRESQSGYLERIHTAIACSNAEDLCREVHRLKGSVGGLRAKRAYDVVCQLEKQARRSDIRGAGTLEGELHDSLVELVAVLSELCESM